MTATLHNDFEIIQDLIYKPLNFCCSAMVCEPESSAYGACAFKLNTSNIRFRVAKITPTKTGQFVTLWKRVGKRPIEPFDELDAIDFFVICVRDKNNFGHFVFPNSVLVKQNIVSKNGQGGKRGVRIYPPWYRVLNSQAKKTQEWQLDYFLDMSTKHLVDYTQAKLLYSDG